MDKYHYEEVTGYKSIIYFTIRTSTKFLREILEAKV